VGLVSHERRWDCRDLLTQVPTTSVVMNRWPLLPPNSNSALGVSITKIVGEGRDHIIEVVWGRPLELVGGLAHGPFCDYSTGKVFQASVSTKSLSLDKTGAGPISRLGSFGP